MEKADIEEGVDEKIRIGLIGCGGIGETHFGSWIEVPGIEIVAICDVDEMKAKRLATDKDVEVYSLYEDMIDETELDAVDVCTPPKWHAPVSICAMDEGLHVICEKPLARDSVEAQKMVEVADEMGVILMTAFCHRFHQPVMIAKKLIDDGMLGRIVSFRNRFAAAFDDVENTWFSQREIAGGGVLMDTSVHSVDIFRYLVGEVKSASARTQVTRAKIRSVEDTTAMLLESENGAIGVVEASWNTPFSENIIEIYGEKGAAIIDYNLGEIRYRMKDQSEWIRPKLDLPNRFVLELRHFISVIDGREDLIVSGWDGLRAIEVIEEAYQSARM